MVPRLISVLGGRAAVLIAISWLVVYAIAHLWPAAWWFEVRSLQVLNTHSGQPVQLVVERYIKREFVATWSVTVRALDDKGGLVHACAASEQRDYKPSAVLPPVVTLDWWTNGACATLPVGRYVMSTSWRLHGAGIAPDQLITVTSNAFEVHP